MGKRYPYNVGHNARFLIGVKQGIRSGKSLLFYANYTSDNLPKAPVFGYVRKNQPFLIIFNYTIG